MAETNPALDNRAAPRRGERTTERVKDTARRATQTAKARASDAGAAVQETLDTSPLTVLAGAIATGAVAAALIPTTRQELQALGPWAESMREALEDAFEAAKKAGVAELTAGGLTFAAASNGAGGLVGKVVKAATAASGAAATSVKSRRAQENTTVDQQMSPAPMDV